MLVELISLAALQALLVAIALVAPRQRSHGERLLGALLVVIALELVTAQLVFTGGIAEWPHLLRINTPLGLLYAPLCYGFCRSVIERRPAVTRTALWHLLPALLVAVWFVPLYAAPVSEKLAYLARLQTAPLPVESLVIGGFKRLQMLFYLVLSVRLLMRAPPARRPLSAMLAFSTLALSWLGDMFDYLFDFGFGTTVDRVQMAGLGTGVLLLTLAAMFRARVVPIALRRRRAGASSPVDEALGAALARLFTTEKVFLDPRLTLPALAEKLATTPHEVSRLINERGSENFASYVNRHRVAEAQRLLEETEARITEVAFAAGFNSVSTFNAAFRRVTGHTPSEYRASAARRPSVA